MEVATGQNTTFREDGFPVINAYCTNEIRKTPVVYFLCSL